VRLQNRVVLGGLQVTISAVADAGAHQFASNIHMFKRPASYRPAVVPLQLIKSGNVLFCDGDAGSDVFQVVSGTMRFFTVLFDGRRLVAGFAVAGEYFSLSYGGYHVFSAEAVSDCSYRRLARSYVLDSQNTDLPLREKIAAKLHNEPWMLQSETLRLLHKTADEAIAYFIYNLGRRLNPSLGDGSPVKLDMSRADIADFLGLTVETVCRGIKRLMKEGIVEATGPHDFFVKDLRALRLRAGSTSAD
jgi:CRP/FNR family transcriptional regulator